MTFTEALAQTNGYRAVARPVGSTMREGLGWRIDRGAVRWHDPTLIQDWRQYNTPRQPSTEESLGEWEVVGV